MANIGTRFLLFISSYFPLALIFFFLFIQRQPWVAIFVLIVGLGGLIGMMSYLRVTNLIAPMQVKIVALQRRDAEAMSYIVSYVIPFLAAPFSGWEQGVALTIFFIVLGVLYVNSNMIHINPMLNLCGYHLYEITLEDGGVHSLIARNRVVRGQLLSVVKAGEDILLEKMR